MVIESTKILSALIVAVGLPVGVSATASADEQQSSYLIPMHRMYTGPGNAGRFHLRDNQKKSIINLMRPQHFSICIGRGSDPGGAVVSFDGKQSIVEPGECHDFEAAVIEVAPPEPLADGFEVHGSYQRFWWPTPLLDQE